ncbi:MAG: hypothetical protein AAGG75_12000 [Bacteroidota bacterium]
MSKKNFKMGVGNYYFNVRNGQSQITIMRKNKQEAEYTFLRYQSLGKDCNWLGCWNGKSFDETTTPTGKAA